jgi:para-nitrobenzyl esterase
MKKITSTFTFLVAFTLVNAQQTSKTQIDIDSIPKVVRTASGILRGETKGDVTTFKGIPYAAAPVGEFRWRPPQPVKPWKGEKDATQFCKDCGQAGWGQSGRQKIAQNASEDCLALNIWNSGNCHKKI